MGTTCLISASGTLFASELAGLLSRSGRRVVRTAEAPGATEAAAKGEVVAWNRVSSLSARSVVVHIVNKYDSLDEVVIAHRRRPPDADLQALSSSVIEQRLDSAIKGVVFLTRECLARFKHAGGGRLVFVELEDGGSSEPSAIEAASAGAFREFATAIMTDCRDATVFGVRARVDGASQADAAELAVFIYTGMQEQSEKNRGRWIKYGGRGGLFSFGKSHPRSRQG